MKVHEYNEMMAYLLRPRQKFAPGGPVTKKELIEVLSKAGVEINVNNFAAGAKALGIELDTKNPNYRVTHPIYIEPTKKELKDIKVKQDKRLLQDFRSGPGRKAYELREKRIIELLKKGDLTVKEIDAKIRKEFGQSSQTTIIKLKKDLGLEIPSGIKKGIKNPKTKEIIDDLNILKNNTELNNLILKPDFSLIGDISKLEKIATEALPNTKAEPIRRVGQLLLAYSGEDPELQKYIGSVDNNLVKASNVVKTKMAQSDRLLSALSRIAAEKRAAVDIGKPPAFFANIRKRLGETINKFKRGLNLEIDEAKAIGGARAKTSAYNLFVQGIKDTVNQEKGNTIDRLTQNAELDLQNAKTNKERIKIKNEYNKKVKEFVKNANKNLKPGQLPIRALEISFDKPSKTIQNKQAYKQYKNMFDDIYKKHRYSFKVPKDVMTGEQAKTFLKTKKGQDLLTKQTDLGSQRLFANPFLDPKLMLQGLGDVARFFGTPSVAAAFAGTTIKENLEKGDSLLDAATDKMVGIDLLYPELAKQTVGRFAQPTGRGILSMLGRVAMNPFGRAARAFTPVGAGITAIGLGKDYYDFVQSDLARKAADPEAYAAEQEEQMSMSP